MSSLPFARQLSTHRGVAPAKLADSEGKRFNSDLTVGPMPARPRQTIYQTRYPQNAYAMGTLDRADLPATAISAAISRSSSWNLVADYYLWWGIAR